MTDPESRLQASDDAPWVSVRSVSQHLFCHRAGVITHEGQNEDTGCDGRPIRLGYLPRYDLRAIEALIGKWITGAAVGCVVGVLLVALFSLGAWLVDPRLLVFGFAVLLAMGVGGLLALGVLFLLVWRLTSAKQTPPEEPEFASNAAVLVDWWGLHAAGFELQPWPAALRSDDWRLMGKPWGVLARGGERVPVFFDSSNRDRLEKKHYARMAAYCLLLRREANVDSPFGVILRPGKSRVEAIPNTTEAAAALADGVTELRASLDSVKENRLYVAPALAPLCADCPLGQLRPIAELPAMPAAGAHLHAKTAQGPQDSVCGVRFQWRPPHASAVLRGSG